MKYGLIGDPVSQSWSPEIHACLTGMEYTKVQVKPEELGAFLNKRDFTGINVTIPHKQAVIEYLDELDESAKAIGAVNCIVNTNGILKGFNTDYCGFRDMLVANQLEVKGQRVAILGSGGASKAVAVAIRDLEGIPVIVSRHPTETSISYETLYENEESYFMVVNATPLGMGRYVDEVPVDLSRLPSLKSVVDIVANPLRTRLLFEAQRRGLKTCGGFEMLVRQAFAAEEYFLDTKLDPKRIPDTMSTLLKTRRNIVLIGMPASGKSHIARAYAAQTGKTILEMDEELEKSFGMEIKDVFATMGEETFRKAESELCERLRAKSGILISTGGGVIKNPENMRKLSENGFVVWIQRDIAKMEESCSRPLSSTRAELEKRYEERKALYADYADVTMENNTTIPEAVTKLLNLTGEGNSL